MAGDPLLDDLPLNLPEDMRAFLACTGDVATIANGPVAWVEIPPNVRGLVGGAAHPELHVTPGAAPSTAILRVKAGWVAATLPAAVVDGRLSIDTSKLPMLAPRSIATDIQRFVEQLNARLAANGKAHAQPSFGPSGMTIIKVDRPG